MNKIFIKKNMTNEKIQFVLNDKTLNFTYDGFEYLIDFVLNDNSISKIDVENEELNEYKILLQSIIDGVNTPDFQEAVKNAREDAENLKCAEEQMNK